MTKRTARLAAVSVLTAGLLAVPAAGAAFASQSSIRGVQEYSHSVMASTGHVSYSENESYCYSSDDDGYGSGYHHSNYGHGLGYHQGLLGLGLIIL